MTEEERNVTLELTSMFPDFGVIWGKYIEEEVLDEEDEECTSIYTVAQEFSKYIISLYYKNDIETIKKAFDKIEELSNSGSQYISEAATVGFIEGVLVLRSHKGIPLNAFDEWLSEGSKKFWYDMHDFFTGGH